MATIFNGSVYGGSPGISTTVNYEYVRDGANMKYHFWGNTRLSSSNGWYYNNVRVKLYLNGSDIYTKDCKSSSKGWSIDWDAGWHTVSNKTSGTTPFYFTVKDTQNSGWCNYTSGTYQLDVAPAYTSITGFSVSALSETSVRFNWSAANTVDYAWYSTNNGSSWNGVDVADGTSGSFDVGGLSANTGYNFKIRVRRKDSQLTTDSGAYYASTYAYPYLTSVPEFIVGNSLTISIYNPLGRSCVISVVGDNGTEYTGGTITGTNISGFNNSGWLNNWYATLPNKTSGTYKARLKCTTGNVNQLSSGTKYSLNTSDTGFKPTFVVANLTNISNSLHTDINGTDKFIKNHNNLSGIIKPMTPNRSSSGSYYNISSSGLNTVKKDYSSSNITFTLGNMSTDTFNVTAVDSRGFSTTVSKTITLIDYFNPYVISAKITRQNGIGEKAILSFSGKYTNWSGLSKTNSIQSIKYKIGSGSWKSLPSSAKITNSNGTWTLNATLDDIFSVTSTYSLYLQITDLLETVTTKAYTISTADAFIWKDLANKRIGIGKKPDHTLDINGTVSSTGTIYGGNEIRGKIINRRVASVGSDVAESNGWYKVATSTMSGYGNTNITFLVQDSYYNHSKGILNLEMRSNNGTISCWGLTWLSRDVGIGAGDMKIVIIGTTWTLYAYRKQGRYGRLSFHLLSHTNINGDYPQYSITFYENNTTKETTTPTATVTSTDAMLNITYPVGSIYLSATATSPASLFGGTWTQLKNRFLFATNSTSGNKGKNAVSSHTGTAVTGTAISANQMPSHTHTQASCTNPGDHAHQLAGAFGGPDQFAPYSAVSGNNSDSGSGYSNRWAPQTKGSGNHTHTITLNNTGGGQTHNHSVSYIEVYVWQRTA